MHNQRNRLNIFKGIIYHHFISKNTFIKNLVKSSVFNCPLFYQKLKDFERALFVCNPVAIKMLEETLFINLKSLEKKSNADIQIPFQKNDSTITEKNIVQFFNKLNGDLLIMIANLEDILFFLLKKFKEFLIYKEENMFYCVLTTVSCNNNNDNEFKQKIYNFKSKIINPIKIV
ncbi:hypothetical protein GVAV_003012 [Gurleya vavrai]